MQIHHFCKLLFFSLYQFLMCPIFFSSENTICSDYIIQNKLLGFSDYIIQNILFPYFLRDRGLYYFNDIIKKDKNVK